MRPIHELANSSWDQEEFHKKYYPKTGRLRYFIEKQRYNAENDYKRSIKKRYIDVDEFFENRYPGGLFTKHKDYSYVGVNIITKKFIAEILDLYHRGKLDSKATPTFTIKKNVDPEVVRQFREQWNKMNNK